jgi:hypothetical protein
MDLGKCLDKGISICFDLPHCAINLVARIYISFHYALIHTKSEFKNSDCKNRAKFQVKIPGSQIKGYNGHAFNGYIGHAFNGYIKMHVWASIPPLS